MVNGTDSPVTFVTGIDVPCRCKIQFTTLDDFERKKQPIGVVINIYK